MIPVDNEGVVKDVHRTINAQTPTYDLLSPDFDILQAIRTKLNELPIQTTLHTLRDTKTEPSCGTNSTFEQKSMCLLTNKLMTSTGNPHGRLACSLHGSLATIQRQFHSAFKARAKIGLDQFFRGRIAKAWRINWHVLQDQTAW
jgi:hypothetical protein